MSNPSTYNLSTFLNSMNQSLNERIKKNPEINDLMLNLYKMDQLRSFQQNKHAKLMQVMEYLTQSKYRIIFEKFFTPQEFAGINTTNPELIEEEINFLNKQNLHFYNLDFNKLDAKFYTRFLNNFLTDDSAIGLFSHDIEKLELTTKEFIKRTAPVVEKRTQYEKENKPISNIMRNEGQRTFYEFELLQSIVDKFSFFTKNKLTNLPKINTKIFETNQIILDLIVKFSDPQSDSSKDEKFTEKDCYSFRAVEDMSDTIIRFGAIVQSYKLNFFLEQLKPIENKILASKDYQSLEKQLKEQISQNKITGAEKRQKLQEFFTEKAITELSDKKLSKQRKDFFKQIDKEITKFGKEKYLAGRFAKETLYQIEDQLRAKQQLTKPVQKQINEIIKLIDSGKEYNDTLNSFLISNSSFQDYLTDKFKETYLYLTDYKEYEETYLKDVMSITEQMEEFADQKMNEENSRTQEENSSPSTSISKQSAQEVTNNKNKQK